MKDQKEHYRALEIFRGWLQRDRNFTEDQAWFESALVDAAMTTDNSRDQFVSYPRKGATKRLNRKDRIGLFLSWQNAQNHASVETEMKEERYLTMDQIMTSDNKVRYTDWNWGF